MLRGIMRVSLDTLKKLPMTSTTLTHPTLATTLWSRPAPAVRNVMLAIAGSLALWVSAKIQIPFFPVPMTMQTLVVLVIGMAYGWKLGAATVGVYLLQGAVGLPVFAGTPEKGIGLAYMMGPTGGFLVGFVLAAAVVGFLAQRGWDRNTGTTALAMVIGNATIYVPGLLWLGMVVGWDKPVLQWGMTPFLLGDVAKLLIAALLMPAVWKLMAKR